MIYILRYKANIFVQMFWLLWRGSLGLLRDPFYVKVQLVQSVVS